MCTILVLATLFYEAHTPELLLELPEIRASQTRTMRRPGEQGRRHLVLAPQHSLTRRNTVAAIVASAGLLLLWHVIL